MTTTPDQYDELAERLFLCTTPNLCSHGHCSTCFGQFRIPVAAELRKLGTWRDLYKSQYEELCSAFAAKAERIAELEGIEVKYRCLLWLTHGHDGLYGDDGEMQCGKCVADFKRGDLTNLESLVSKLNMERIARAALEK